MLELYNSVHTLPVFVTVLHTSLNSLYTFLGLEYTAVTMNCIDNLQESEHKFRFKKPSLVYPIFGTYRLLKQQ
jgi:hypothetical protein